ALRLRFVGSAYDYLGSGTPIVRYDLFRRIDAIAAPSAPARVAAPDGVALAGWDYLSSVPANAEDEYDVVVPTLADSNGTGIHRSAFRVRASTATPGQYYDSAPDSGYSVDNLPPAPPTPFTAAFLNGVTNLHWGANTEPDLWYYALYRGSSPDFVP